MKYIPLLLVFFLYQCATSNNQSTESLMNPDEIEADNFAGTVEDRLAQMLRRESGVIVQQSGSNYQVKIRGLANSFVTNTSPLFMIDGVSMGHNFQTAASAIAGVQIKSIRVLKGKDAAFYGTRGSAGVIEIKTKTPTLPDSSGK